MSTHRTRRGDAPEIIRLHDGRYLLVGEPVPIAAARALGAEPHPAQPAQAVIVDGDLIDGLPRPPHPDADAAETRVHAFTALWQSALPRKGIGRLSFDGETHTLEPADLVTMLEQARELRHQAARARTVRLEPTSIPPLVDAEQHTPERIRGYLAARGWNNTFATSMQSEWKLPGMDVLGVSVLHNAASEGYRTSVARLVRKAAESHRTGELDVLDGIAATKPPPGAPPEPPIGSVFTTHSGTSWTRCGPVDAAANWRPVDGGEQITWEHLWARTYGAPTRP